MQSRNRIVVSALSVGLILGGFTASSQAAKVLVTGESPDSGQSAANQIGTSGITFYNNAVVDSTPANAKFGSGSISFNNTQSGASTNKLQLLDTQSLGSQFTLAAEVNFTSPVGYERLFSSGAGGSFFAIQVLQFQDPNYSNQLNLKLAFYVNGSAAIPMNTYGLTPATTAMNAYHSLVTTFDNGDVKLYWDGSQIASATGIATPNLTGNIFIAGDPGGTSTYPFYGRMDDILVYDQALSAGDVSLLGQNGAAALLVPEPASMGLILGGTMLLVGRRRRQMA
ncbi:MAG: PEP-CTERM sorting domain-containing protein [Phycisphaerales bacterium]|nr:PEP-CTERM sorting domain-containing protein [Phycisphaerales bacterium]